MAQDLTSSQIDRQNILNNKYALQTIQQNLDIQFVNPSLMAHNFFRPFGGY